MTNPQVPLCDQPNRKASCLDLGTDVGPRSDDDEELQFDAKFKQVFDVSVAAKVINALRRTVISPMNVQTNCIESHAPDLQEERPPSLPVRDSEILKLGGN